MSSKPDTQQQQFWRDHVRAAATHDASIAKYPRLHNFKIRDFNELKTLTSKRGCLPLAHTSPPVDVVVLRPKGCTDKYRT